MNTATVEYNPNNKVAIGLLDVLNNVKGVKVKINYTFPDEEKCPYSKEFQAKMDESIKQAEEGRLTRIDLDNLWK